MSDGGGHSGAPSPVHMESTTDRMAELLQFLMEDRRKREELAEERRQRAEEQRHEQEQQFLDDERQKRESQRQMELLQGLLAGRHKQGESAEQRAANDRDMKLAKLSETDDIEAYLITFERLMVSLQD